MLVVPPCEIRQMLMPGFQADAVPLYKTLSKK